MCTLLPTLLRTEYRRNPLGIDETRPRFSWIPETTDPERRGAAQAAWEIEVAEEASFTGGFLWRSGRREGAECAQIEYAGEPLRPGRRLWWRVRIEDQDGAMSPWSETAHFSMGLLGAEPWTGKWIEGGTTPNLDRCRWMWHPGEEEAAASAAKGAVCLQRQVLLDGRPSIARITFAADSRALLLVNGGERHATGRRRGAFPDLVTVDLSADLREGENLISIIGINEEEGTPAGITGKLLLIDSGNRRHVLPVDESWRAGRFGGEEEAMTEAARWHGDWPAAIRLAHVGETDPLGGALQSWGAPGDTDGLILPPPGIFRKSFHLDRIPTTAVLRLTSLGIHEAHINGRRVGNDHFAPGWSDYRKRVYYQTHEVAELLREGENTVAVVLADGWHSGYLAWGRRRNRYDGERGLLAQLEDGAGGVLAATDTSWSYTEEGPIREADHLMGTRVDARRDIGAWNVPGEVRGHWEGCFLAPEKSLAVEAHPGDPVREDRLLPAQAMSEPLPGVYIFDLGQNMVGVPRIRLRGPRGTEVRLRFAEVLNEDGTLYTEALRGARSEDVYIKGSDDPEVFQPPLTFHGFRHVEVRGLPTRPAPEDLSGVVLHSLRDRAGEFRTSNVMVNRLYENIVWGQMGNFLEVPTDCPQRDERLGWTGDAQIFIRTATCNHHVGAFFTKWLRDLFDSQNEEGWICCVAPRIDPSPNPDICFPAWADAAIICPWTMLRVYNDRRIVERYHGHMVRYMGYLARVADNHILPDTGFGDWVSLNAHTPRDLLATAYYAQNALMMADMSEAIGRAGEAGHYRELYTRIRSAFRGRFLGPDGRLAGNSQTCHVLAIRLNLLEPEELPQAGRHLAQDIAYRGGHFSTGFIGLKDLMPALSQCGRDDLAYELLLKEDFPSWGYEIRHGATTIWERWDGWSEELGLQNPGMNSFNHYSFGAVGEWLFTHAAGIDTAAPGFAGLLLRPRPSPRLPKCTARLLTNRGWVHSQWRVERDGSFHFSCRIPPSAPARVILPVAAAARVSEGGIPAGEAAGVRVISEGAGGVVLSVDPGHYQFACTGVPGAGPGNERLHSEPRLELA